VTAVARRLPSERERRPYVVQANAAPPQASSARNVTRASKIAAVSEMSAKRSPIGRTTILRTHCFGPTGSYGASIGSSGSRLLCGTASRASIASSRAALKAKSPM
jgi:hypothetical protein